MLSKDQTKHYELKERPDTGVYVKVDNRWYYYAVLLMLSYPTVCRDSVVDCCPYCITCLCLWLPDFDSCKYFIAVFNENFLARSLYLIHLIRLIICEYICTRIYNV